MNIRYAIWTAVSTTNQATDDKISLTEQERHCRAVGAAKGWHEIALYKVPGESRTRWVNLRDAEKAIPALRQMLQSAKDGAFDILILYDYNRLRDLLDPVAKVLTSYGVQIYSVSQPIEPAAPAEYNAWSSDSESMMRGMSQIISRAQINDLRRKFKYGMPARIKSGLPKGFISYGYRKPPGHETDRKAIPVADPIKSAVVIQIKDLYLSGRSLWQIAHHLNGQNIPTPAGRSKWANTHVRTILKNRFYVGEVYIGK